MNLDEVVALACRDGAISLSQLRDVGVSKSAIAHRVHDGRWLRPHREVYVVRSLVVDEHRALARAAILAGPSDAVLSHAAAARLYGIQGIPRQLRVDLTLPPAVGHRAIRGVRIHRSDVSEIVMHDDLPLVTPARALRGVAAHAQLPALLSAVDSALHLQLVTKEDLHALRVPRLLDVRTRWLRALELADGRAESPLESRTRLVIIEAGLGPVDLQVEITVDGITYRIDIAWCPVQLGLEADGKDAHDSAEALLYDRRRQNALFGVGWPLVRSAWEDVTGPPDRLLHDIRRGIQEQRRRLRIAS